MRIRGRPPDWNHLDYSIRGAELNILAIKKRLIPGRPPDLLYLIYLQYVKYIFGAWAWELTFPI